MPGSEVVILELKNLSNSAKHNSGAIHFGEDGKLYIGTGKNSNDENSQSVNNLLGKILRINKDGSIPNDNPFFLTETRKNRAIWVLGLPNPFTFTVQPGTGRIFINDVGGGGTWEEIKEGIAGANYGWPGTKGPPKFSLQRLPKQIINLTKGTSTGPEFHNPFYVYGHGVGNTKACAIVGGAFYNPATVQFSKEYIGHHFVADFCNGWIPRFEHVSGIVTGFATGISFPVDHG